MSPVRRDVIAAVLLSGATAAVSDLRPPTLDETTGFITTAVRRHHVAPAPRDDHERGWTIDAEFAGCSMAKRTVYERERLGAWEPQTLVVRWQLGDLDADAVEVTTPSPAGERAFLLTLRCADDRACIDEGLRRTSATSFAFTSAQMAQRAAAAFRYAANLCHGAAPAGNPSNPSETLHASSR